MKSKERRRSDRLRRLLSCDPGSLARSPEATEPTRPLAVGVCRHLLTFLTVDEQHRQRAVSVVKHDLAFRW